MTRAEKLLAGRLLATASNTFSHRNCNDMSKAMFENINVGELLDLVADWNKWNNSPADDIFELQQIGDYSWMRYLADKLKEDGR